MKKYIVMAALMLSLIIPAVSQAYMIKDAIEKRQESMTAAKPEALKKHKKNKKHMKKKHMKAMNKKESARTVQPGAYNN